MRHQTVHTRPDQGPGLSPEEIHEQVHMHDAGRVALPDRRFHELFEDRVRAHPDAVAVRYRGTGWTYEELNGQANRIAHSLLRRGLRADDVVAVVTDRNLEWAAAVLGVLKAGGVYLPIDVAYPVERAATQVRLSGARYVLAGEGGADPAGFAGDALVLPLVPDAGPGEADQDPLVAVVPGQAAYIYFTSGSTGLPKGAICEHLGMLNHLLAKVEALELGATDVVVQNAPIGFDISLWQLIAVLLVGGRVEIVPAEAILDAGAFLDTVAAAGATVLQVVPSYLDVLLGEVEVQHRPLGPIRRVSVTGEAVSAQLVERWFARFPDVPLVNAYGATEASDDTTHAILYAPTGTPLVPVGRPIRNVTVYVVDDQLRLVPRGSVGEIVFSGICVGRGYANDPERTREAFTADPFRPGERLYRTGDFGRWLPDGNLEFVGRRDDQVKVRGMRVETGEVEHVVRHVPGVRSAAVVVRDSPTGKRLIACYAADPALTAPKLLERLRAELPAHLVPAACHRLDELPLTENGKTDRKALLAILDRDHQAAAGPAPAGATQRRLAVAWAEVLGRALDTIAADDDFFALGGDSLAAVRLVVKLDRAVSLTDLLHQPVLRDLAAFLDADRPAGADAILQRLAERDGAAVVVCVPDASGNALDFQQLAHAAGRAGIAVRAAELPGHDVGGRAQALAGVDAIAEQIVAELADQPFERLMVWGHGSGTSVAVRVALLLERAGRPVDRLFVASRPLHGPADVPARIAAAGSLTDLDVKSELGRYTAFTELDGLKPERTRVIGTAYRHDVVTDLHYLADLFADGTRVPVPVTLVAARDDPDAEACTDPAGWRQIADDVSEEVVERGGRQFHRTEPELAAQIIVRAVARGNGRRG